MLTSAAVWALIDEGRLSFMDRIADHLPEFAQRGKGEITLHQVMTHQGGFPSGDVTKATWIDHARMRAEVCDFSLDWTPGTRLQYHPRAAHLTQAMVIEAVTGQDYRDVIRDKVIAPLGLGDDIQVGVPPQVQQRCADTYAPEPRDNSAEFRAAGLPSGGGFATARGMAAFAGARPKHAASPIEGAAALLVFVGFGRHHAAVIEPAFRQALDRLHLRRQPHRRARPGGEGQRPGRRVVGQDVECLQIARRGADQPRVGIEHDGHGNRGKAYLYCLETRCPKTGWMVPMAPSWIISKTRKVVAKLVPDHSSRRYDIEIHSDA